MWLIIQAARGKPSNEGRVSKQFVISVGCSHGCSRFIRTTTRWHAEQSGNEELWEKRQTDGGFKDQIHRCAIAKTKILTCTHATVHACEIFHSNRCRQLFFGPKIRCLGRASSCSPLSFSSFKFYHKQTRRQTFMSLLTARWGRLIEQKRPTKLPCICIRSACIFFFQVNKERISDLRLFCLLPLFSFASVGPSRSLSASGSAGFKYVQWMLTRWFIHLYIIYKTV